jgi:hypothetical protein
MYQAPAEYPGMRFPYSAKQACEVSSGGEKLGADRLKKLRATSPGELRHAAILAGHRICLVVAGRIDHVDAEPGARARRMLNTSQYRESLARLASLGGSGSE